MNVAGELDALRAFLAGGQFRVAVIGGVALAAYGNPRMTLDLDVATDAAAQDALIAFMSPKASSRCIVQRGTPTIATPVEGA